MAPSLGLRGADGLDRLTPTYPFSVPVEGVKGVADLRALYRDHFEGSAYDLTAPSYAGGAWGTPNRPYADGGFDPFADHRREADRNGAFERAFAIDMTMHVAVVHASSTDPSFRFSPNTPHGGLFMPVPVKLGRDVPELVHGSPNAFAPGALFWLAAAMQDYLDGRWALLHPHVEELQRAIEAEGEALLALAEPERSRRLGPFHTSALQRMWDKYWDLHVQFQSGMAGSGNANIGLPDWVMDKEFVHFAEKYPDDRRIRERYDHIRSDLANAQQFGNDNYQRQGGRLLPEDERACAQGLAWAAENAVPEARAHIHADGERWVGLLAVPAPSLLPLVYAGMGASLALYFTRRPLAWQQPLLG